MCSQMRLHVTPAQQAYRWLVVYAITSPLTLGCLVVVKLLVIHRFAKFLDPRMQLTPRRLILLGRLVFAVAVFGSTVAFCCNAAAASYFSRASALYDAATTVTAIDYNATITSAKQEVYIALELAAVFFGFESALLLLIVTILVFVGVLGARSMHQALRSFEASNDITNVSLRSNTTAFEGATQKKLQRAAIISQRLLRQMVGTVVAVFVSFLIRTVYSVMFAIANAFQDSGKLCDNYVGRCSPCYNNYTHMQQWMLYTPGFQLFILLASQPVALLVGLWGMTSGHTMAIMRGAENQNQNETSI
jgi:hypothetical protein